jgi:hypothetical protein
LRGTSKSEKITVFIVSGVVRASEETVFIVGFGKRLKRISRGQSEE